jgi:hypothetical protein
MEKKKSKKKCGCNNTEPKIVADEILKQLEERDKRPVGTLAPASNQETVKPVQMCCIC